MFQSIKTTLSSLTFGCLLLSANNVLWASALDLTVSDEAGQIKYESAYDITNFYYSLGVLSFDSDADNTAAAADGKAWYIGFALTEAVSGQFRVGLGVKINQVSIDVDSVLVNDFDGGALAIGGYAHLFLPANEKFRMRAEAYFGPDAIAYDDISEYSEFGIQFEYNIIQNAVVMLGYRQISVDIFEQDFDLDDDAYFGVRLEF